MLWSRLRRFGVVLYRAAVKWQADEGSQRAAAVAYYMALSFFPLLIVLISLGGILVRATGWGQDVRARLSDLIAQQTSPALAQQVESILSTVELKATSSGPLGLAMLVFTAMLVFAQFEAAFDRIWSVSSPESRGVWATIRSVLWDRFRAFLMLLCVGVFMIAGFLAAMTVSVAAARAETWLGVPHAVFNAATAVVAVVFNWLLFTIIYWAMPKAKVRWSEAARGGLLTSLLWEIGRRLLASIVVGSKYSVYGVVGAFIAVMLWVYYAAAVVFLGAEFVRVAWHSEEARKEPQKAESNPREKPAR